MNQFDAERSTLTLAPRNSVLLIQQSVKILVSYFSVLVQTQVV